MFWDFKRHVLNTLVVVAGLAGAVPMARADQVITEDLIVSGELLCVGLFCVNNEALIPGRDGVKIKGGDLALRFDDTSFGFEIPSRDWQITINDRLQFGAEAFRIEDVTAGTIPFAITGTAPDNALFVAANGHIGMGTQLPQRDLHMVASLQPTLRLEQTGVPGAAARSWDIAPGVSGLELRDATGGTLPLQVRNGAPNQSLLIASNGNVGLGTNGPAGKLHTRGNGVQLVYFESGDGGPVQVRMRSDSPNRRFLAVNNANQVQSQIIFADNQIRFTGTTDAGADRWLTIGPSGIVSQGPTCASPCDAVFDPAAFTVPPIAERAALMWEQKHLPAVGPTRPGEPMNLTEKMGGVIHELEVAHIYIEELDARMARMQEEYEARIAELTARLDGMEAQ